MNAATLTAGGGVCRHFRCYFIIGILALPVVAGAECTWVLWASQEVSVKGGPYQPLPISLMSAYTTAADCIAKLDSLQMGPDSRWAPTTLDRYMNNSARDEIVHVKWQCLPDTLDLRGPKTKP